MPNGSIGTAATPAQIAAQNMAANAAIRRLILEGGMVGQRYYPPAVDMFQPLNPLLPATPGTGSVVTIPLRNVGLIKRVILQIKATVTAGATSTQNLTKFGLANLISNVLFTDLANNQRINTTGWHLVAVASAKRRRVYGSATTTDTPFGYGNVNTRVCFAPNSISASGNSEIDLMLEIPFTKDDRDLRGAIFGDVNNASMFLQFTLNPNMFVASGADATNALYQSAGSDLATLSGVTVQVWQQYLDQLPQAQNGVPLLPPLDIGTAYLLNNTSSGVLIANQNNAIPFVNARQFESVFLIYDNNGTLNINGSDINNLQITSANFTQILAYDGRVIALRSRNLLGDDFPAGSYYFDFRHRPIDTAVYGNMQIIVNPSSAAAGSVALLGWESYGLIGQVNQGGSLPSGGT